MITVEEATEPLMLDKAKPVHFVGIGGIGMSGLARILLEGGFSVSGSDVTDSAYVKALREMGAVIHIGHQSDNVPENAMLIVSTAINPKNPEIARAHEKDYPIYHRSQLLKEILEGSTFNHRHVIGITGSHGKTTISGMTAFALTQAGMAPTFAVGGYVGGLDTNGKLGKMGSGSVSVAELDESDGTLLQYRPTITYLANLELDHAEHFPGGLDELRNHVKQYLSQLPKGAIVVGNTGCPEISAILDDAPEGLKIIRIAAGEVFTPEESEKGTFWLKNVRHHGMGCYQGYVYKNQRMLTELHMNIPGMHNLLNGLAALSVGELAGADCDDLADALREFTGMKRRFERVGEFNHARFIDDYAHHPTEVAAVLKTAKETLQGTEGRVIVVFQPHRYTRLQALWDPFSQCFDAADKVILTDVYEAHEEPIKGITSEAFIEALNHPDKRYIATPLIDNKPDFSAVVNHIKSVAQSGDLVLSMGAGTITALLRNW